MASWTGPAAEDFLDCELRVGARREGGGYPLTLRLAERPAEAVGELPAEAVPSLAELETLEEKGAHLLALLFAVGAFAAAWERVRAEAPARRLRLALAPEAPELHALPWEALNRGTARAGTLLGAAAVAANACMPSARRIAGTPPPPITTRPVRLLAAVASPANLGAYHLEPLNLAAERRALSEAVARSVAEDELELCWIEPPVTLARLEAALTAERPHLFHLVAHGKYLPAPKPSLLFLEAEDGSAAPIDEGMLADSISRLAEKPHLVFLASCESARRDDQDALRGFAPRLVAAGVPAVLAMQGKIAIDAARAFAATFYRSLSGHGLVDVAAAEARSALLAAQLPDAALPVLATCLPRGELIRPRAPSASDEVRTLFLSCGPSGAAAAAEIRSWLRGKGFRPISDRPEEAWRELEGRERLERLAERLLPCRALLLLVNEETAEGEGRAESHVAFVLGRPVFPLWLGPGAPPSPSPAGRPWIDLGSDREAGLRDLLEGLYRAGIDAGPAPELAAGRPPYPGLFAFDEADAAIFFGREREVTAGLHLLARMRSQGTGQRLLLILGASGSGKSSLLRAGLLPKLRRDALTWRVLDPFRPGDAPLAALEAARRACDEALCSRQPPTVLLTIDQLEELFSREGAAAAQDEGFAAELAALLTEPGLPLLVVATLRSDFLPSLQQHRRFAGLAAETLLVGPLDAAGLSEVIEKPAKVAGIELEAGLSAALAADALGRGGLPLLALVLHELWQKGKEDDRLDLAEYREGLGGLEGAVERVIEEVLDAHQLDKETEAELRHAFTRQLVQLTDDGIPTRRAAPWSTLRPRVREICERMIARRLLKDAGQGEGRTVEVAHEAVLSWRQLRSWLDEERGVLLRLRRLNDEARAWAEQGKSRIEHGEKRLREVVELGCEEGRDLEPVTEEYLSAVKGELRRRKQRPFRLAAALSLVALLLASAAWRLWVGPFRSLLREHLNLAWSADGRRLVAGAYDGDLRIWNLGDNPQMKAVIAPSFIKQPRALTLNRDGTRLLTTDLLGRHLIAWHLADGGREAPIAIRRFLPHQLALLSGEGALAVLGFRKLELLDPQTGKRQECPSCSRLRPLSRLAYFTALAPHPGAPCLAVGTSDGTITLVETAEGGEGRCHFEPPEDANARQIHALAFAPSGRYLASAEREGAIEQRDVITEAAAKVAQQRLPARGSIRILEAGGGLARPRIETASAAAIAWDEVGDRLAYSSGLSVFVLELASGASRELHAEREVLSIAFQPGQPNILAILAASGCVTLWDVEADQPEAVLEPGCRERQ